MSYSVGDGNKLKVRVSHARHAGLVIANEFLKLAAEALQERDNETASVVLTCARKIKEAIEELREKMP